MPLRELVNGLDDKKPSFQRELGRGKTISRSLYSQGAAPSSPNMVRSFRADSGIVRFSFTVIKDSNVKGYNIYRGGVDNASVAERVDFVSQPNELRTTNVLTWDDPYPDNTKQYYYVAAVNEVGTEGARVGSRTDFLAASGSGSFITIGAGTGDPSGSSNSYNAIATAEASMGAGGGVIFFLPGTYRIDSKLTLSKPNIVWEGYGVTIQYNGVSTSRLMNITASGRTFRGITFSGGGLQVSGCLIYIGNTTAGSADDNVDNCQFIDCTISSITGTHQAALATNLENHQYGVFGSPYGVTNTRFINTIFKDITQLNDATVFKSVTSITVTNGGSGYVTPPTVTITSPGQITVGSGTAVLTGDAVTSVTVVTTTGIFPTGDTLTVNFSGGGGTGAIATANSVGGFVGGGTCGAFFLMKLETANETFDDLATVPTVISSFYFEGCHFDNIRTILAGSLTEAEYTELGDADAIRMQGGSGVTRAVVKIIGCHFNRVSKRAAKASITSFSMYDCDVIADKDVYPMINAVRIADDSIVSGLRVYSGTALAPISVISFFSDASNVEITNVLIEAAKYAVTFVGGAGTIKNVIIDNMVADSLSTGGIVWSAAGPTTLRNFVVSNSSYTTTSDNGEGITLSNDGDGIGGARLYDVEVINGSVKISGYNNIVDGLHMTVNRSGFDGPSATRALLEMGTADNANLDYNILRNCHLDIKDISTTFTDIDRQHLFDLRGDKLQVTNLTLRVPTTLNTTYSNGVFGGTDTKVSGVTYEGPGFLEIGKGTTNGSEFNNFVRKGYGLTASVPFIALSAGANNSFANFSDKRSTLSNLFSVASGGPYLIDGIAYSALTKSATLTRAGSTVTATVTSHGWATNTIIVITGATEDEYNGVFSITNTGADSFTYVITGTPSSPATGTIFAIETVNDIINDNLITVRNDFLNPVIIRKINTVTVTANSQDIRTLSETLILTASSGRTSCTLQPPLRENLSLTIIAAAGTSDVGLTGGTSAIFPQGDPTFGVGSGAVRAMTLRSASISSVKVWVEEARALVGSAGSLLISDTAYNATTWDSVTTIAPSKNAVRDKIETLIGSSAYTQTYATADRTHDNFTSADIGAFTGGATGFVDAAERDNIRTQFNALRADVADIKQLVNAIIDDMQTKTILT